MRYMTKQPTSFRLSQEATTLLTQLSESLSIPRTAVIEIALRRLGKEENVYKLESLALQPEVMPRGVVEGAKLDGE